jgi:hypothetical protein
MARRRREHKAHRRSTSDSIIRARIRALSPTTVIQAALGFRACGEQHRLQRHQSLLFFAISGKKLESINVFPPVPHDRSDPQRSPIKGRSEFKLNLAIDGQLSPCEDGDAVFADVSKACAYQENLIRSFNNKTDGDVKVQSLPSPYPGLLYQHANIVHIVGHRGEA